MALELQFGRPITPPQALIRLPGRSDPEYKKDGSSTEHVAHFKEWVIEMFMRYMQTGFEGVVLADRSIPLNADDMRLVFGSNSYWPDRTEAFTLNWAYIEKDDKHPWADFLPMGDDEHRWWQITTLTPDTEFGEHTLYCIEANDRFDPRPTSFRFDERSDFELVFATKGEIEELKQSFIY